ncbi:2-hydroxyacid dehydrogenase [Rhizorhabdus phycosphaerae]|uniref:2-hydroxyacid dehydrogenase n=1 Tax=Rhizorhabdus phycosphaerae TaxID=2711156 RepID=UPI003CD0DBAE
MTTAPTKPLVLLRPHLPLPALRPALEARFELRSEPAPGITAMVASGVVDAALMDSLPDLELIALGTVGYDGVDLDHARRRGISVTNTPDVLTDDVADLAVALILAVHRKLPRDDAHVRAGRWPAEGQPSLTRRFSGRRTGIVGLGRIGLAIAKRLEGFEGEIAYHARHPREDAAYRYAESAEALAASVDVLVVATPGGAETEKLIDRRVIDALGPDGVIVNIARGSVIDEEALVSALVEGRLGGAGLDVFAQEPHVPEALRALETVVLLPHQGSGTIETRAAMAALVVANLDAFFAGKPLPTPIR